MSTEAEMLRLELQKVEAQRDSLMNFVQAQQNASITSQPASVLPQSHRVNVLSRSQSSAGHGSSAFVGDHGPLSSHKAFLRQQRAYSQQSTLMHRANSNRSETSMPFRPLGPISPLENQAAGNRVTPQSLANIQENDVLPGVGVNPAEFLAAFPDEGTYLASTRPNLSPNDIQLFQNPSACPSMYSGVSAMDATSPMTRQNSTFDNGTNHWSTDMIPTASSHSMYAMGSMGPEMIAQMNFGPAAVSANKQPTHQDLLGLGANLQDASAQQYPVSSYDGTLNLQSDSTSMERSGSNSSTDSNRSTGSSLEKRAKERHKQVLKNGRIRLEPKPQESSDECSPPVGLKKAKVLANKPTYQRRKQPRVFCNKCSDYPKGFRGDHELQRHSNAKHSNEVTKFVCRDPATVGLSSPFTPKVPLKGCKSCDSGKQYGAYYNAAAHLRRAHFVPKTNRSKGKGSSEERRGGKAGGNWPPMEVLKYWYEKTTVTVGPAAMSPDDAEDDMEDIDADVEDESVESMEAEIQQQAEPLPVVSMPASITDWSQVSSIVPETQITVPDSQDFMHFPNQMGMENSPGNLSYAEDGSPVWGSAASGSFASPALGFMSQGSTPMDFPDCF